jgi:hypothetical protein
MSQKAARSAMPLVTAWIDDLRWAFGADIIDGQIRAATRDGLPTFHASEAGRSVGVPLPMARVEISAAQMVILRPGKATDANR